MKKPVIGISASIIIMEGGRFPGYRRSYVNEDYVIAVSESGAVPYILPIIDDESQIEAQIANIDALVLSGGHDVNPKDYGEEPMQKLGTTSPERDAYDYLLIKHAMKRGIPILGICRGHQVINVYFGGSLYQDLEYIDGCFIKHDQFNNPEIATHTVHVSDDSKLKDVFGKEVMVNSFHHLAVKDLGKNLRVVAKSSDGLVEAIEYVGYPYLIGVQWHPEMMAAKGNDKMKALFVSLIEAIENV